jgi:NTP pyrophosphatase (non-canonical NTP hydrolase)
MQEINKRNYDSIVNRKLISKKTTHVDFMHKLNEEVAEVKAELISGQINKVRLFFELADVILVCLAWIFHYKENPEKYIKEKIIKNEKRIIKNN